MGRGWWAGPGLGRPGPASPARPIIFLYDGPDGPRPGPAHQILIGGPRPGPVRQISERGWAAARPRPSNFWRMGRGPTQPITFKKIHGRARPIIFSNVSARPDPAHHMAARPMRHGLSMGRPMCSPGLKGACACSDVIFLRYVLVSLALFFPVWIPWDSCFRPETP